MNENGLSVKSLLIAHSLICISLLEKKSVEICPLHSALEIVYAPMLQPVLPMRHSLSTHHAAFCVVVVITNNRRSI